MSNPGDVIDQTDAAINALLGGGAVQNTGASGGGASSSSGSGGTPTPAAPTAASLLSSAPWIPWALGGLLLVGACGIAAHMMVDQGAPKKARGR